MRRDTTPDVFRRQMAAIAARSIPERMEEWAELNRAMSRMEGDAIKRRHPEYTDRQVFLAMVKRRYGDELAARAWPDSLDVEP